MFHSRPSQVALLTRFSKPQGHVQVLLNILRGFTVQAALDAPRFCISPGMPENQSQSGGAAGDANSEVYFEDTLPKETVEKLIGACPNCNNGLQVADLEAFRNGP